MHYLSTKISHKILLKRSLKIICHIRKLHLSSANAELHCLLSNLEVFMSEISQAQNDQIGAKLKPTSSCRVFVGTPAMKMTNKLGQRPIDKETIRGIQEFVSASIRRMRATLITRIMLVIGPK